TDRIKNLYGSVAGDVDQNDRSIDDVGQLDLNQALIAVKAVIGPDPDDLRRLARHLLQLTDRRSSLNDACNIGSVDLIGNDVSPGKHVARFRIPNDVGIVDGCDHLNGDVTRTHAREVAAIVVQGGDLDGTRD